jgi:hypothetical protein
MDAILFRITKEDISMTSDYFNREEGLSKVGTIVEAAADFPSVPRGSAGTVVKALPRAGNEWSVVVEWHLPRVMHHTEFMIGDIGINFQRKSTPVRDQFNRAEYEALLKVISDC